MLATCAEAPLLPVVPTYIQKWTEIRPENDPVGPRKARAPCDRGGGTSGASACNQLSL